METITKMKLIIISALFLCSCANVSTTRFVFKNEQSTLIVEIPKEIETKKLKVKFNAQQGTFEITSESWISRNSDTIAAQSSREKAFLEGSSALIEKTTEGAVRGAMKGIVPLP